MIGHLSFHRVDGRISIDTVPGKLYQRTEPATMTVEREKGGLEISTAPASLRIDCTECWEQDGLKSAVRAVEQNADAGKQAALEFIGQTARIGDILSDLRNTDAIRQVARMKADASPAETGGAVLSPRPDITYQPKQMEMNYTPDTLTVGASPAQAHLQYVPASVRVGLLQEPQLTISWESSLALDVSA